MSETFICLRTSNPHEAWCITCLAQGKYVHGSLEDFAHRCPKHLPDEAPHVIYIDPFVLQAYLKCVPWKNVVITSLGDL